MTKTEQCKKAGLAGSTELERLTGLPRTTLTNWYHKNQTKFKLAIDAALYRKEKHGIR